MLNCMNIPDVMTVKEVASILRVGKNAVYDSIRCGQLRAKRIGKSLRVTRPALLAFLEVNDAT